MKTIRIAMIAMVLAFVASNLAYAGDFKPEPRKVCNIVFAKAMENPGLVNALASKVDPDFLKVKQQFYLVEVNYNGVLYRVLGSRQQWVSFFWHIQISLPVKENKPELKD